MVRPLTRVSVAIVGSALLFVSCGGSGPSGTQPSSSDDRTLSGSIAVDGSSTVFPITEAVAEEFQIANPGVRVAVAFSGTGGGFKKFCTGETDVNDASRSIKGDDPGEGLACAANGIDFVELQVAIDGLTVVVSPDNDFVDCLTVEELATIYGPDSPERLLWSDVRPAFPARPVVRFMPGADSGTFDYFTEEINGETDAATRFATQSEDDNVLVTGVGGEIDAIGFFGYAYFVENSDKVAAVPVDGGAGCIKPTEATINDNSYAPLSRPLFIYADAGSAAARPELKAFVDFYLDHTSELSAEVGYVALPDTILQAQHDAWMAAVGG